MRTINQTFSFLHHEMAWPPPWVFGLVLATAFGLAARPFLSHIIAGLQIAITQPNCIDDVVVIENEFGNVEDIGVAFVVIRL
ncbi:MAG: mechanosensitive ion channel domain-containing protein [Rhodospirillaceae bacterium]